MIDISKLTWANSHKFIVFLFSIIIIIDFLMVSTVMTKKKKIVTKLQAQYHDLPIKFLRVKDNF